MRDLLKRCLLNGLDVSFKDRVFISKYSHFGVVNRIGYQVHLENDNRPFSKIYTLKQLDEAIDKFEELRKNI